MEFDWTDLKLNRRAVYKTKTEENFVFQLNVYSSTLKQRANEFAGFV